MKDGKLLNIAKGFRQGIVSSGSSRFMCFAVTAPLHSYLGWKGYEAKLIEGEIGFPDHVTQHFWLELPDGRILDPTADQFSTPERPMPEVYIGELPGWYKPLSHPTVQTGKG